MLLKCSKNCLNNSGVLLLKDLFCNAFNAHYLWIESFKVASCEGKGNISVCGGGNQVRAFFFYITTHLVLLES